MPKTDIDLPMRTGGTMDPELKRQRNEGGYEPAAPRKSSPAPSSISSAASRAKDGYDRLMSWRGTR